MTKKRKKPKVKRGLQRAADAFAMALIFEASGGRVGRAPALKEGETPVENPVSFRDRRALLDSVTKLLAGQPAEGDEEESGVDYFRDRLKDDGDDRETGSGADSPEGEAGVHASSAPPRAPDDSDEI